MFIIWHKEITLTYKKISFQVKYCNLDPFNGNYRKRQWKKNSFISIYPPNINFHETGKHNEPNIWLKFFFSFKICVEICTNGFGNNRCRTHPTDSARGLVEFSDTNTWQANLWSAGCLVIKPKYLQKEREDRLFNEWVVLFLTPVTSSGFWQYWHRNHEHFVEMFMFNEEM